MSAYKKGDRVKVTIEGVVSEYGIRKALYVNGTSGDDLDYVGFLPNIESPDVTVERLPDPPLPTTPGSLIRLKSTNPIYRTLHEDGLWHPNVNGTPPYAPEELAPERWDVVYDAGKA